MRLHCNMFKYSQEGEHLWETSAFIAIIRAIVDRLEESQSQAVNKATTNCPMPWRLLLEVLGNWGSNSIGEYLGTLQKSDTRMIIIYIDNNKINKVNFWSADDIQLFVRVFSHVADLLSTSLRSLPKYTRDLQGRTGRLRTLFG